jgi:hypothetical protein
MRTLFRLIILVACAWLLDLVIFDGRYNRAFWQNAQLQGQKFRYEVQDWINKTGL